METTIDLSKPGETTVLLHQTCSISHGEALYLRCELDDEWRKFFSALSGSVVIKDSNGNEVGSAEINSKTVQYWAGKIMLTGFAPFCNGDYNGIELIVFWRRPGYVSRYPIEIA